MRMKYLGIDYGTKRVGIATSDDEGRMAFPFTVLQNTSSLVQDVKEICVRKNIDHIVVGESLNNRNMPNPIMGEIRIFTEQIRVETGLSLSFMPEMYSSREAMHIQGDNEGHDASAAAIILQSYIESIRPQQEHVFDDE